MFVFVGDILKMANQSTLTLDHLLAYKGNHFIPYTFVCQPFTIIAGAEIQLEASYQCNLDYGVDSCKPEFTATRLDSPDNKVSSGFNYRLLRALQYAGDIVTQRIVTKNNALRIQVLVTGMGRQFSIVETLTVVGSGVALLGTATVVCDILIFYISKRKTYYRDKKYRLVRVQRDVLTQPILQGDDDATC